MSESKMVFSPTYDDCVRVLAAAAEREHGLPYAPGHAALEHMEDGTAKVNGRFVRLEEVEEGLYRVVDE